MKETAKILIIDDDYHIAEFIKQGLEAQSFITDVAYDGLKGKSMLLSNEFDLAIIDLNLPYVNGFELCRTVRENNLNLPIIILTAMDQTDDILAGFDSGTDDYLVKPFEMKELVARIKALLRRSYPPQNAESVLTVGDLEMDVHKKLVRRGNTKINLTAKEFILLEFLLRNKERVVTRGEISQAVWDIKFDTGTNVIDVYVNFLRKKIDKNFNSKIIHTVFGMGYMVSDNKE